MTDKDYIENGITYNLDNIWEYMEKDYWDSDDLKFDFWYRMLRHQQIFNEVMERNGLIKSNYSEKDCTPKLLKKLKKKNKKYKFIKGVWEE